MTATFQLLNILNEATLTRLPHIAILIISPSLYLLFHTLMCAIYVPQLCWVPIPLNTCETCLWCFQFPFTLEVSEIPFYKIRRRPQMHIFLFIQKLSSFIVLVFRTQVQSLPCLAVYVIDFCQSRQTKATKFANHSLKLSHVVLKLDVCQYFSKLPLVFSKLLYAKHVCKIFSKLSRVFLKFLVICICQLELQCLGPFCIWQY